MFRWMTGTGRKRAPPPHFLKQWRKERALTQAQLAERVNTTHATISRFETGAMRLDEDWIVLLAAALRIRPGDLFRSPDGNPGTKTLAERIERLSPDQREIALRLLDALEPEPAKAKGQDR